MPRSSRAAKAFDVSQPLHDLAQAAARRAAPLAAASQEFEVRPERGPIAKDRGFSGDGALQGSSELLQRALSTPQALSGPSQNFEGLSNQDNFNIFGFRVNPPDPVGDVGPNHYVEMVNLAFAVYDKTGQPAARAGRHRHALGRLRGPGLHRPVRRPDRALRPVRRPLDPQPVHHARPRSRLPTTTASRSRRPATRPAPTTATRSSRSDAVLAYFFPDYPKYGVWTDSYVITTRDFGPTVEYGISVYALEKNKMIDGQPERAGGAVLPRRRTIRADLPLVGDGLLPADIDGKQQAEERRADPASSARRTTAAATARRSTR